MRKPPSFRFAAGRLLKASWHMTDISGAMPKLDFHAR